MRRDNFTWRFRAVGGYSSLSQELMDIHARQSSSGRVTTRIADRPLRRGWDASPTGARGRRRNPAMTSASSCDRDAAVEALLAVARRETLALAVATCALDPDAAAVASARLRWAIGAARPLVLAHDGARTASG